MNKVCIVLFLQIACELSFAFGQEQLRSHNAILAGFDLTDISAVSTGSFEKKLGYRAAYVFSFNALSNEHDALQFKIEGAFSSFYVYSPNVVYNYNDMFSNTLNYLVEDQQFKLSYVDIGIDIAFVRLIANDITISILAGMGFGGTKEWLGSNTISRATMGHANSAYPTYMYGPHGEYNMDAGGLVRGFNGGINFGWKWLLLDLRYRTISYMKSHSIMPMPKRVVFSVGYMF